MNCNVCGNKSELKFWNNLVSYIICTENKDFVFNIFIGVTGVAKEEAFEGRESQKPKAGPAEICKKCLIKAIKESK